MSASWTTSDDLISSVEVVSASLVGLALRNLAEIDLADYIWQLATSMVRSYQGKAEFDLRLELEKVDLGIDQAVPCGLIVNELITNALKYASTSGRHAVD